MGLFKKFAFIISSTVTIALIYSLVYYTALSHGFGPEGSAGNVDRAVKNCIKKCRESKNSKSMVKTTIADTLSPKNTYKEKKIILSVNMS